MCPRELLYLHENTENLTETDAKSIKFIKKESIGLILLLTTLDAKLTKTIIMMLPGAIQLLLSSINIEESVTVQLLLNLTNESAGTDEQFNQVIVFESGIELCFENIWQRDKNKFCGYWFQILFNLLKCSKTRKFFLEGGYLNELNKCLMDEQLRGCAIVVMKSTVGLDDHTSLNSTMLKIRDVFLSGIVKPEELIPMLELSSVLVNSSEVQKRLFYNIRKPDENDGDKSTRLVDLFCLSMFNLETPSEVRTGYFNLFNSLFGKSQVLSGHMVDTIVEHSKGGASLLSDELGLFIPQACLNQLMNPADFYSCKISSKLIVTCIYNQVENANRLLLVELQGVPMIILLPNFCFKDEVMTEKKRRDSQVQKQHSVGDLQENSYDQENSGVKKSEIDDYSDALKSCIVYLQILAIWLTTSSKACQVFGQQENAIGQSVRKK